MSTDNMYYDDNVIEDVIDLIEQSKNMIASANNEISSAYSNLHYNLRVGTKQFQVEQVQREYQKCYDIKDYMNRIVSNVTNLSVFYNLLDSQGTNSNPFEYFYDSSLNLQSKLNKDDKTNSEDLRIDDFMSELDNNNNISDEDKVGIRMLYESGDYDAISEYMNWYQVKFGDMTTDEYYAAWLALDENGKTPEDLYRNFEIAVLECVGGRSDSEKTSLADSVFEDFKRQTEGMDPVTVIEASWGDIATGKMTAYALFAIEYNNENGNPVSVEEYINYLGLGSGTETWAIQYLMDHPSEEETYLALLKTTPEKAFEYLRLLEERDKSGQSNVSTNQESILPSAEDIEKEIISTIPRFDSIFSSVSSQDETLKISEEAIDYQVTQLETNIITYYDNQAVKVAQYDEYANRPEFDYQTANSETRINIETAVGELNVDWQTLYYHSTEYIDLLKTIDANGDLSINIMVYYDLIFEHNGLNPSTHKREYFISLGYTFDDETTIELKAYVYMTDDERKIFDLIYYEKGYYEAINYLIAIEDRLNQRVAVDATYETLDLLINNEATLQQMYEKYFPGAVLGYDPWLMDLNTIFQSEDTIKCSEYERIYIQQFLNPIYYTTLNSAQLDAEIVRYGNLITREKAELLKSKSKVSYYDILYVAGIIDEQAYSYYQKLDKIMQENGYVREMDLQSSVILQRMFPSTILKSIFPKTISLTSDDIEEI